METSCSPSASPTMGAWGQPKLKKLPFQTPLADVQLDKVWQAQTFVVPDRNHAGRPAFRGPPREVRADVEVATDLGPIEVSLPPEDYRHMQQVIAAAQARAGIRRQKRVKRQNSTRRQNYRPRQKLPQIPHRRLSRDAKRSAPSPKTPRCPPTLCRQNERRDNHVRSRCRAQWPSTWSTRPAPRPGTKTTTSTTPTPPTRRFASCSSTNASAAERAAER